jgi:hypothetical protein
MDNNDWQGAFESNAIDETMRRRREFEANEKWIIEPIFPAGAMHLIGGPSGHGKTTWLLQMLHEWEQGLPLIGKYKSNPCPWVYVCCDRSLRETTKTLQRLGYHNWRFEAYGLEDLLPTAGGKVKLPDITDHVLKRFPDVDLFVIEGLQALMPDVSKGRSQNKQELLWAVDLRNILGPQNKTIIATTHSPKVAAASTIDQDARSKFLGSQGFIGTCSTMVGIERDAKAKDTINAKIMGRNFADIDLKYTRDSRGMLQLETSMGPDGKEVYESEDDREIAIITFAQNTSEFTAAQCRTALVKLDIGRTTMYRILVKLVEEGILCGKTSGEGKPLVFHYNPTKM